MKTDYKKIIKFASQGLIILIVIFLLLNIFGKIFIEQISQDLFVSDNVVPGEGSVINQPAPYFEIQNLKGKSVKVSDFKGIPVVLVFWNTWNDISSSQMKVVNEISSLYADLFKILAINSQENRAVVYGFINRSLYTNTEVLLDVNGGVSDVYEARNMPAFYFLDSRGFLMEKYYGFLDEKQIVEKISKFSD